MDTTADRSRDPTQLELTNMDPESFERFELPTRRPQIVPVPPPSSPRLSTIRKCPQDRGISPMFPSFQADWTAQSNHPGRAVTLSTNQWAPSTDTRLLCPSDYDQHMAYTPSGECYEPEANGSMQADSWSQDCSSCSEEEKIMDEGNSNDMGRSCVHESSHNRCKIGDASRRTPLGLKMPKMSSRLPPQPTIRPSNASQYQPLAYDLTDLSVNTPPPSYSASPLLSPPSHTAFQPFAAPYMDPNECSFMNFDDSDLESCEKRGSKAGSVSRCFDQKRGGETKKRFRHSISEVFSALSCAR